MEKGIEIEYRGHKITYNEDSELWTVNFEGSRYPHTEKNLKTAKHAIDRTLRKDFKPMDVYIQAETRYGGTDNNAFEKVTITAISVNDTFSIKRGGKRTTHSGWHMYEVNPKNEAKIKEIAELARRIEADKEKLATLHRSLKGVDTDKLRKEVLGKEN